MIIQLFIVCDTAAGTMGFESVGKPIADSTQLVGSALMSGIPCDVAIFPMDVDHYGRTDLVMMELAAGTTVAGVFTTSKCPGAPVDWCRASLAGGKARAVGVNAGNANVFTGKAGRDACAASAAAAAQLLACPPKQVFVASTGVIGERLPHEKLVAALPALHENLRDDAWEAAARGIMTTDTFPKGAAAMAR